MAQNERPRLRPLTARQSEVLAFLEDYVAVHRFPPTSRELSVACSLGSPSGAHRMLRALERKGYLQRSPRLSRALTLVTPKLSPEDLRADELFLVASLVESQAVACDCSLVMAARLDNPEIKEKLIRDALERHQLVVHAQQALPGMEPGKISGGGAMTALFTTLRTDTSWPIFVVDHLIYDRSSGIVASRLAEESPILNLIFARVSRFCERASRQAEQWLEELLQETPAEEFDVLRDRAGTMMQICEFTARALEKRGPRHKLHFTDLMNLPPVLRGA